MTQGLRREEFRSVLGSAQAEVVHKRSRFLASAWPVWSEAEAQGRLGEAREAHPGASHVCFAYRVGIDSPVVRMSDDREPQGTAGRPILEVLERNGLDNVLAVVVRYFGGTLLGAAGLTRAYAGAAAAAVNAAGVARYARHSLYRGRFAYADWPRVQRLLHAHEAHLLTVTYLAEVEAEWAVLRGRAGRLAGELADATAGSGEVTAAGERYLPLKTEGS